MKVDWRFVLSLLFVIIVAIFAVQNSNSADVNFLHMHLSISQALIILFSAIVGAVTVSLLNFIRFFKLNAKMKAANKSIAALKEENEQLKQALALEKSGDITSNK